MPYHSEKQVVLDTVYAMIEEAGIWIPYKEVDIYYRSKISRYRSRVLHDEAKKQVMSDNGDA